MRLRFVFALIAAAALASADTVILKSGKAVEGTYLGGSARQVRLAVGDSIQTFDVGDIASIQFEGTQSAAAAATPTPTPAPAPVAVPQPNVTPQPAPAAAQPAPAPQPAPIPEDAANTVPSGTQVTIRMIDDVDSKVAKVGQTFRASVDDPVTVGGQVMIPKGADVVTKLVEVKQTGTLSGGGQLTLEMTSITVDGKPLVVNTASVTQAGQSRTGDSAKVIGGTAALGAIIGAIAGGGKGAAIGAASGAGAGTAVRVLTKGPQIKIPSETRLTFTLQQPVRL